MAEQQRQAMPAHLVGSNNIGGGGVMVATGTSVGEGGGLGEAVVEDIVRVGTEPLGRWEDLLGDVSMLGSYTTRSEIFRHLSYGPQRLDFISSLPAKARQLLGPQAEALQRPADVQRACAAAAEVIRALCTHIRHQFPGVGFALVAVRVGPPAIIKPGDLSLVVALSATDAALAAEAKAELLTQVKLLLLPWAETPSGSGVSGGSSSTGPAGLLAAPPPSAAPAAAHASLPGGGRQWPLTTLSHGSLEPSTAF